MRDLLVIENIDEVRQAADGSIWLNVTMSDKDAFVEAASLEPNLLYSPTPQRTASVNASHIIMALELAST